MIRITGGRLKGRQIASLPVLPGLRPTTSLVRESLMGMLTHPNILNGARFLDLCAGSGLMGLEAWSRGAAFVLAVEKQHQLCRSLTRQASTFSLSETNYAVMKSDVTALAETPNPHPPFDVAYLDPPYAFWTAEHFLEGFPGWYQGLSANGWLAEGATLLVEHPGQIKLSVAADRERPYGETTVSWFLH